MTDIMLDLETLSTEPNATILTIGAIKFNRADNLKCLEDMDTFYRRISITSCKKLGLHIDKNTEQWWEKQDDDAKYEAIHNKDRVSIKKALKEFNAWFGNSKYLWSHGDDFDCVILGEAMKACNIETPWMFWNTRDTRTLFDIGNVRMSDLPQTNKHHALHDCYRQLIGLKKSFKNIL
jgi:DNA polymerase III epsilon subunit-like protein